jgi:hypothetical protein
MSTYPAEMCQVFSFRAVSNATLSGSYDCKESLFKVLSMDVTPLFVKRFGRNARMLNGESTLLLVVP